MAAGAGGGAIASVVFLSVIAAAGASPALVRVLASGWRAGAVGGADDKAGTGSGRFKSATITGSASFMGATRVPCHTATTAIAATPAIAHPATAGRRSHC